MPRTGRPPANMARIQLPGLTRWPVAPRGFSAAEREEWRRLGRAAMAAGCLTEADLLAAELYATSAARLAAMRADPAAKATATNSLATTCAKLLAALGLTPASRKSVQAPSAPRDPTIDKLVNG